MIRREGGGCGGGVVGEQKDELLIYSCQRSAEQQ